MYLIIYFAQSYVYFFIFTIFLLIIFNKNKKSPIHIEDFSFKIIFPSKFRWSENCNTVSCKNCKSWCQWHVPVTSSTEARNSSAFSVEIYIKDFTREIICESLKYFLRSNILKKISSKDLPMVCFVVTQHSESERFR